MSDGRESGTRYVVAAVAALALIGLLAFARGDPGEDGRVPAYDGEPIVVVVEE